MNKTEPSQIGNVSKIKWMCKLLSYMRQNIKEANYIKLCAEARLNGVNYWCISNSMRDIVIKWKGISHFTLTTTEQTVLFSMVIFNRFCKLCNWNKHIATENEQQSYWVYKWTALIIILIDFEHKFFWKK